MKFQLEQATEVLASTPAVMDALLRGKSAAWLNCRVSADAFSPVDVLGHLMLADVTNWFPRAQMILEHGETKTFGPFDRFAFRDSIADKPVDTLLDEFAVLRKQSLQGLHNLHLDEQQLARRGTHPEFGPVTLSQLLSTWVVHDLGHVSQVVSTLANEYGGAVGPWRAYLKILQ